MNLTEFVTMYGTGSIGSMDQAALPEGWANVTEIVGYGDDRATDYFGPILHESDTSITLEVFNEPLPFLKKRCIIDHALDVHTMEPTS